MPDRIENLKIVCAGGLNSNENHLDLSDNDPGVATRLVNFEPSLYGGYRRINGYTPYKEDYAEVTNATNAATGPVLGLAIYKNDYLGTTRVIACRELDDSSNTYGFYQYVPLNGWQLISGAPTPNTSDGVVDVTKVRSAQFNFGDGNHIIFVDGVNKAQVYDGQNWYELNPTASGGSSFPGGDQLIDQPSVVEVFERHIFLSGDHQDEALVVHSAPNDPFTWTVAAGAGQLTVGTDVVNIKPFRDQLFVFGPNAIKKVTADVADGTFVTENVTSNVGCIARDSVVEIGGDLMFLAPDGLRPVAGTSRIGDVELGTISKSIQGALVDIIENFDMSTVNAVVVRRKSQVRFFVGDDNDAFAADSLGIIGGLTDASGSIEWEFGTLLGIRASCCTSGYVGTEEFVLHGDYDGKVYRQEQGNDFNGGDIVSVYATPYLDFGDAGIRKTIRQINTFIRAEGPFELNVALSYDWGDYSTARPSTYTQESTGAPTAYGSRNIRYGGTNVIYGGSERPIMTTDVQGSGFSMRATFVTVGQYDPFSIQGLVIDFTSAGRR
jgi:hypothetical protein